MPDARWKAYGASALVFALDRITKIIIAQRVSFLDSFTVIPGFFSIVRSENRGVAFGILNDSTGEWRTTALVLLSAAAVVLVSVLLWNATRLDRLTFWGLALILGGAAGNLFDRVVSGRVTDFLELYLGDFHWPTFNLADSAIVIGSGLFIVEMFRPKRQAANVP